MWSKVLGWIVIWRVVLLMVAGLAARYVPLVVDFTPSWTVFGMYEPYWAWIWGNFDGVVFMLIAQSGYSAEQLPFFPLLPLLIAATHYLLALPHLYAGILVSAMVFLVAQYYLWQLLKLDKKTNLYWLLLAVMLFFPTSLFYTAIYADALFLALASATLYYARRQQWGWASVVGMLAALARLNGLALIAVVGMEYLLTQSPQLAKHWDWRLLGQTTVKALQPRRLWRSGILWCLLIPAALVGYLIYIQLSFGDWHLFFTGVTVWHRDHLVFPLQTFWRYFKILVLYPRWSFTYAVAALEAGFTGLYLSAMAWSWGKIRLSYWLMIFCHLLIPVVTGTLQGMPRYGLHLYPLFLIYALWLHSKPRWVKIGWLALSALISIFYLAGYTRGYFVA